MAVGRSGKREVNKLSKKTKATKHAARARSKKKRRPNPLKLPRGFKSRLSDKPLPDKVFFDLAFDHLLFELLRQSGIRDALLNAIRNAPPKRPEDDEEEGETIQ